MATQQEWFTVQQLRGLPGMPTTDHGVLIRLRKTGVPSRRKSFGKGREYALSGLPEVTQDHLDPTRSPVSNLSGSELFEELQKVIEAERRLTSRKRLLMAALTKLLLEVAP
ncbi:MAG: hypothetical protein RLY71_467 [Pseudomonadota bacterium]|jgi:hypothetical protein